MKAKHRFILAVGVLGLLMTGPFTVTSLLVWLDMRDAEREMLTDLLLSRLPIGTVMTLFGFAIGVLVLHHLFKHYVEGLMRMAETLRMMLNANRDFRVVPEGPPEVVELAEAANSLAAQRDTLMDDVDAQIATAKASVEEEKNRLAALMSELAQAIVVCNLDGRILLYNNRARLQFRSLATGPTTVSGGAMIGLGRSIYSILEKNQVQHAREVIHHRLQRGKAGMANFITTTRSGQLLRIQMVPVLSALSDGNSARAMTGYVLSVDNITRTIESEAKRNKALHTLTEGNRMALSALRSAISQLMEQELEPVDRARLLDVVDRESQNMSHRLEQIASEFGDSLRSHWPLDDVLGVDVIAAAQRRLEERLKLPSKTEEVEEGLWIKADSYSLVFALVFLASRLQDHYEIREARFRLLPAGHLVYLDLIWSGPSMSSETFYTWELESMDIGDETTSLSLRDVIDRHGGQISYEREKAAHRAFFRFVLPMATPDLALDEAQEEARHGDRPEYYDFDLFRFQEKGIDLDKPLAEMAYTVFDTETTGLEPSNGDEIIQIGATRIINNRLLRKECFNQFVDPGFPLRAESTAIHGITDDMLRGQPAIDMVLPAFHQFCEETVLVAHNAAFDMRFLQLKEDATGVCFRQPVLDTLLLSAALHPNQESHKLDSIAERLGIQIISRHNALDDAIATAQVFVKMVPLLADRGIITLRQALEASEKTYYARVKY